MHPDSINLNDEIEKWLEFRQSLLALFDARKDTVIDLIDSLSSNRYAQQAVQLSENELFSRNYNSLYKAINTSFKQNKNLKKTQWCRKTSNELSAPLVQVQFLPNPEVIHPVAKKGQK